MGVREGLDLGLCSGPSPFSVSLGELSIQQTLFSLYFIMIQFTRLEPPPHRSAHSSQCPALQGLMGPSWVHGRADARCSLFTAVYRGERAALCCSGHRRRCLHGSQHQAPSYTHSAQPSGLLRPDFRHVQKEGQNCRGPGDTARMGAIV